MADSLIGISTKDYVLIACDASAGFSILILKDDEDKIKELDDRKILAANGENGDRVKFTEIMQKHYKLYALENQRSLSMFSTASFLRRRLAYYLRQGPFSTNLLLGGYDEKKESCELYWMDYLASSHKVPFGAQGYGQYFVLGILDKEYRKDMSLEDGIALMKKCVGEVKKRFLLNCPNYICKVVSKDGVKKIEL